MKVTLPTAIAALEKLERLGIVRETTGRKTYRVYLAEELLRVIESAPAKET
jgi:Fic family protein